MAKVLQMSLLLRETQNSRKKMGSSEVEQGSKSFKGDLYKSPRHYGGTA